MKKIYWIAIVIAVVVLVYLAYRKEEGCCGRSMLQSAWSGNYITSGNNSDQGLTVNQELHYPGSCPHGTKWNGRFCATPETCQNKCFLAKDTHIKSGCQNNSNLGNCLNAYCQKKCSGHDQIEGYSNEFAYSGYGCYWPFTEYEGNCVLN